MEGLPASLAERLQELTYDERAVAYLQVDAALTLIDAGGHLDNYGLAALRLGEPAVEQAFFLEGLLPLVESPYFVPSIELDCGRAADLHLHQDGDTVWVVLFDVTEQRDATRRLQQKAYDMTLLQEKEAELNRRLADMNRELEASNDFLARISSKISHYLAPQIYKSIFSGQRDVTIHTERKELTIFFSDIKDFTSTTEHLQPEEITLLLNEYFTEMSAIAHNHGGTVDKFIGDALVIFFGDPETKGTVEDARACLNMATEMQRRLAELNVKWRSAGTEQPFRVRMGVNTGFCNVGNFGSMHRMDYTAIGAEVNLAARLQSIAEPGHIVISYDTYVLVRDIVAARALPEISVKGIGRMVVPYVVEGVLDEAGRKIEIFSEHMTGLDFYLDPRAVDATAIERIRATLKNAIAALEGRGGEDAPAGRATGPNGPGAVALPLRLLPRTPIKDTEKRKDKFEQTFGVGATELDAIEALYPGELGKLLNSEIDNFLDRTLAARIRGLQIEISRPLVAIEKEVHGKYADEITEAEERLDGIVGDLGEWEEETSALWETISDELQERSPEQKEFDFPRSEAPGVTDRFVLFELAARLPRTDGRLQRLEGRRRGVSINGRIIADFELADGRRKQPTQYEAPQKGDKMKAIYVLAVGLMKLNETATAVAADLIWHSNSKTGRCDPSVDRISFEINRPRRSVIRALQELVDAKVILKQRRGQSTNAYHIDWTLLRKIHAAFEERARSATHGTSGCHA